MFLKIPFELVGNKDLTKSELLVLGFLLPYNELFEKLTMSNDYICIHTGLSRRSVSRSITGLKTKGYIDTDSLSYLADNKYVFTLREMSLKYSQESSHFIPVKSSWLISLGLKPSVAIVMGFFYARGLYTKCLTQNDFKLEDLAETLNLSKPSVIKAIKTMELLGAVVTDKENINGHTANVYTLVKEFFFGTEEDIIGSVTESTKSPYYKFYLEGDSRYAFVADIYFSVKKRLIKRKKKESLWCRLEEIGKEFYEQQRKVYQPA